MVKYLINGILNEFESQEEANEYLATLSSEDTVELVQDPKTEEATIAEEQNSIIGKPGFLPDAAKSADVVSEIPPAQDTELISEDGFSGLRYIKFKSGTTVYEDKYLEQYAGTGNYPESFDEYAKKFGTEAQTLPKDATTQGGELDQIVISNFKDKEKPGREIVNADVWEETFNGYGDTAIRALETQFKSLDEYTVDSGNRGGKYDNPKFSTIVTHINPETKEKTTFELETLSDRSGTTKKSKGKGKEFADFIANTMNLQDAATLRVKAENFAESPLIKEFQVTNKEAEKSLGTLESMFAPKTETIRKGKGETMELIVQPYEKEIKETTEKLLLKNAFKSYQDAEDQAKADIYAKMVAAERLNLIGQKRETFLSQYPQLRDEFTVFQNLKNSKLVTDFQDNTLLTESLEIDLDSMAKDLNKLNSFKEDPSKPIIIDGIQWGEVGEETIGTWNDIPITQANYDQLKSMQVNYNATYKTYSDTVANNATIADKMPEALAISRANALNYSLAEKAFSTFGWGVSDIITGTGYAVTALGTGVASIIGGAAAAANMGEAAPSVADIYDTSMKSVDAIANRYSKAKDVSKRGYVRDVSVDEGFSSPENFGKFFLQEVSAQAPVIMAMMATGGYGALTVGVYTGGQAGMEMAFKDALMGRDTKRVNQFLTMAGIGLANAIPTQLTTIPILRKAKKQFFSSEKFGVDGAQQYALGVKDFVKSQYKDVVNDVLLENVGEIATNFAENAIYGNDPLENIKHVAVSSTGFSFVFSGLPFFKGINARAFANNSEIETLSKNADAILAAKKSLSNHQSQMKGLTGDVLLNAKVAEKTLKQSLNEAIKQANDAAVEILQKPLNGITQRGSESFAKLQTIASTLKREIAILSNTKGVDQSIINDKIQKFASVKAAQELYIGSGFRNEFALMEVSNPITYNNYIKKARAKLERENSGKIYSTKNNEVVLEATKQYNIDQSWKRVKQNKKINPNLQVFGTKEEAMDYMDERPDLTESTKEEVITSIERGNAGASVTTQDGSTVPYVVIEAEAENNKQFVQEHEIAHGTVGLIFEGGKGRQLYELGYQIREWLKVNNSSLSARMEDAMQNYENDPNYNLVGVSEEAFMEFLEMVNEKRIDLTSSNNLPLNGMMAQMVQDAVGKDVYDYDFRGTDDFAAFAIKLAKGIKDGSIDIAKAKETIEKIDISKVDQRIVNKLKGVKESMKNASPEMRSLLMQQEEIYMQDGTIDPGTQMINEANIQDKIDELRKIERAKEPETSKKKVEKRKKEPKASLKLTVEEATDRYNDALDAYNNDPDNPALETRVGKALEILDEAESRVQSGEEIKTVSDLPKIKREKKDKSTRRYSLETKEKAPIEIKVAKAKKLVDESKARDKKLKQEALDKIPKDEKKLSRTKQAEAKAKIEANPPRSPKPVELIRLEKEIAEDLKIPLGKANTIFTKLFYDKIPAEAKEAISRDFFKASMESDMLTMVINEFKPKTVNREGETITNDLEDIIFQRGGLRVRNLAKRLGVEQDGITKGEDALVNMATEDTDVKVNGKTIIDPLGKVKISSILASDTRYEQAMEAAIKFWEENEGNSPLENFKKLPGFTAEVMGEMFGLPAAIFDKRISRSPNLNAQQYPRAFEQITKEYGVFKVFEDGKMKEVRKDDSNGDAEAYEKELTDKGIKFERVANQSILRTFFRILPTLSNADYRYANGRPGRYQGKATGVGRNLQDFSYDNIVRKTTGTGNRDASTPKKAYEELLKSIGGKIVDGKPKLVAKPKSKEAQTLLSILRLTNKMISNELSRSPQIGLDPMTVKDLAAGKNVLMESKKQQFNPDVYSNGRGIEKKMNVMFNKFLEYKTGIESFETFDASEAQKIGSRIGKLDIFIPPSAEDFVGLLYKTLPKGKKGEQMMNFYKKNLLNPYAKAMTGLEMARNKIGREYKRLKEDLNIIPDDLKEQITYENENGDIIQSPFTKENAVRVYMWDQKGMEIPNLKEENKKIMLNEILENPELRLFAQELSRLNTGEDTKPKNNWAGGTITTDLMSALNNTGRKELLTVWKNNVDVIFSPENLNKLQVAFGNKYVSALKNSLTRMETGRNRISKVDKGMEETNAWSDFLTNSVGNIMFLNSRSAVLQLISATNFLNFRENNIFAAGKAFANQKQFWSDFVMLWNSDFLVDRRDGLKLNVNEADLANVAATQGMQGVIAKLLKAGFAPTKYADSLAISFGGASFYRTKYDALIKQGVKPADAKKQAMLEFTEIAQESQQSSRPDKISKEQSQPIGRYILAFANTPQQYARIIKKAILDLKNGRGSRKENLAKIAYYGFLQNAIFSFLQQGLFAMAFDDDENEDTSKKDKAINVANSMSNSLLRGMGLYGAVVSAAKDIGLTLIERSEKKKPNYSKYIVKNLANISPPIGSKIGKIYRGVDAFEWNAGFMFDKEGVSKGDLLKLPGVRAVGDLTSALTNVPLDRAIAKASNLIDMLQEETKDAYKPFLLLGYPEWQLEQSANDPSGDEKYEKEKERRKNIKKENKIKEERGDLSGDELRRYDLKKLKKEEQTAILFNKYKLSKKQINKLTKEEDRINKIMSLEALNKSKKRKDSLK